MQLVICLNFDNTISQQGNSICIYIVSRSVRRGVVKCEGMDAGVDRSALVAATFLLCLLVTK